VRDRRRSAARDRHAADEIADAELRDRIAVQGGDFFADALPPGHDVHLY
jgi:hypothetical protein